MATASIPATHGGRDELAEEARLVAAAAAGDLRAFERLYRLHVAQVYGLCLRLTGQRELAEDCTQDSFIAAWRALPQFQGRARLSTWLHRVAVNAVISRRRRCKDPADGPTPAPGESSLPAPACAPDGAPPLDLERGIRGLPQGARDVLVLVGVYGYSHEEAGDMLGVAPGTCKAQLHRARRLLAAALGLNGEPA